MLPVASCQLNRRENEEQENERRVVTNFTKTLYCIRMKTFRDCVLNVISVSKWYCHVTHLLRIRTYMRIANTIVEIDDHINAWQNVMRELRTLNDKTQQAHSHTYISYSSTSHICNTYQLHYQIEFSSYLVYPCGMLCNSFLFTYTLGRCSVPIRIPRSTQMKNGNISRIFWISYGNTSCLPVVI